jgi:hypothetical protein
VNGIFDRIAANANYIGISIQPVPASGPTSITLTNSIVSSNSFAGILADIQSTGGMLIDNVNVSSNYYGILSYKGHIVLGRSVVANNSNYGIENSPVPSTFYTYQNNEIYLNANSNAVEGSSLTPVTYQ